MAEFLKADTPIVMSNAETGAIQTYSLQALLPEAFGPAFD
jgi:cytidine deaminase